MKTHTQNIFFLNCLSPQLQTNSFCLLEHISSSKEKDSETGYSYFGARYYDSDISVWLSVDPLSDKYPSMSAYMYTAGNPVMLVDPDGRDWFMNEKTGDVYYNSNLRKGQEGTGVMEGDGWVHMGKNGMFMRDKNDIQNNDHFVLFRNGAGLANSESGDAKYSASNDGTVTLEASFKGDNAGKFMSNSGYSFVPKEYLFINKTIESTFAEDGKVITLSYDNGSKMGKVNSYQYAKKDLFRHSNTIYSGQQSRSRISCNQTELSSVDRRVDYYSRFPSINGVAKDFASVLLDHGAQKAGESIGKGLSKAFKKKR